MKTHKNHKKIIMNIYLYLLVIIGLFAGGCTTCTFEPFPYQESKDPQDAGVIVKVKF